VLLLEKPEVFQVLQWGVKYRRLTRTVGQAEEGRPTGCGKAHRRVSLTPQDALEAYPQLILCAATGE
jgi:hypothetical protein